MAWIEIRKYKNDELLSERMFFESIYYWRKSLVERSIIPIWLDFIKLGLFTRIELIIKDCKKEIDLKYLIE